MLWLQNLDTDLFRFINLTLMNPLLDWLMPFVSGNERSRAIFLPLAALAAVALCWKGGARGRVFVLMLVLGLAVSDGLVCNTLKHALARPRPFLTLPEAHCLAGKGGSGSMPSSHAANWCAMAMVAWIYYRRKAWWLWPLAALVSFSRVYNGVHYPGDVVAGAILGAGSGAAVVLVCHALWGWAGRKWFPLWWEALPSLTQPVPQAGSDEEEPAPPPPRGVARSELQAAHATPDQHWLRLGYLLTAALLLARLFYLCSGLMELSEDEAYQWLWSKHLALSYYSKPPLIAYTQFLSTWLWGDTVFGVRFFSPVIAAVLSLLTLRFFAREINARAGFFLLLIMTASPLMAVGSILMTIDPLSVLFWTAAMFAGWRAVREDAPTRSWLWVGLWMGLGFLSKYTELFQWLCWAVFFALWRPARKQLRRPGPYLALLVNLVCALPVLVWNYQHDWVTVAHVADDAGAGSPWKPTLRFLAEFLGAELALLNPFFFVGMVWAAIAFWRRGRHNPRLVYFFSMGAPLFLIYLLHSFHSRVLPNWIAPSILPLFCLMVAYWDTRWRLGAGRIKGWLAAGLSLGLVLVVLGHNTDIIPKLTGWRLPVNLDPLHRVRVWSEVARVAGEARRDLLAEGKPVFIITAHYGLTGLVSFYLPEAREAVSGTPLVYYRTSATPGNQFYFWPGYTARKGENAIFIQELSRGDPQPIPPPAPVAAEFESVTDLGIRSVMYHGRLCRPIQVFACRGLK